MALVVGTVILLYRDSMVWEIVVGIVLYLYRDKTEFCVVIVILRLFDWTLLGFVTLIR